jgi:hypothetical protein
VQMPGILELRDQEEQYVLRPRPLTSKDTPTDGSDTAGDRKQAMGRR